MILFEILQHPAAISRQKLLHDRQSVHVNTTGSRQILNQTRRFRGRWVLVSQRHAGRRVDHYGNKRQAGSLNRQTEFGQ